MPTATKLQRVGSGDQSTVESGSGLSNDQAESKKLPSSQYKGVVPQPNGRWGAQIYEKHQRVWLGTFNGESDAAKAYDVAAQRFRGRDAVVNFKPLSECNESDLAELEFLNFHSKAEIVDMLRKHTYGDELSQRKKKCAVDGWRHGGRCSLHQSSPSERSLNSVREHLFEKTVTPSDVGKLNRLVIPKQHAEKHFPLQTGADGGGEKGVLLNFEDEAGKVWRFRYSYWNSSQSYVLTKGWSRFVKEKSLRAGDVVSFQQYHLDGGNDDDGGGGHHKNEKQLFIDCKPRAKPIQVVRLFGVNIFMVGGLENNISRGKRRSGSSDWEDLFPKKQRVRAL